MTKHFFQYGLATIACLVGNLVVSAPSYAADRICTSSVGAVTVSNLIIPDGATCTLTRTLVLGNVEVGANAALTARGVNVRGNIQGDGARAVTVNRSVIGTSSVTTQVWGNIEFQKGAAVTINEGTRVRGNIITEENSGLILINNNFVTGNVKVEKNRGGARINSNTIGGNLQCQDNVPAPTGAKNLVRGNKENQCRRF